MRKVQLLYPGIKALGICCRPFILLVRGFTLGSEIVPSFRFSEALEYSSSELQLREFCPILILVSSTLFPFVVSLGFFSLIAHSSYFSLAAF